MSGKAKQDVAVAGGRERLAVCMGEFRAVVGADHSWLCAVTPPLLFFPVCCLHDV